MRLLGARLFVLWLLIGVVRALLTWGLSSERLSPNTYSAMTFVFLPIIMLLEGIILLKSAREIRSEPREPKGTWDFAYRQSGKRGSKLAMFLLTVYILCVPYALWITRFEKDTMLPTVAALGINFLLVSSIVFRLSKYQQQPG